MRTIGKKIGAVLILLCFSVCGVLISLLPAGARMRRLFLLRNVSLHARLFLKLFGVRVHCKHKERLQEKQQGRLLVANHVSYVDILVISSIAPSVFITSRELGGTLFLGLLARLGGSLFVERRKVAGLKKEIEMIARILKQNLPVVLFPEGTTSNGERVHAFKNALFDAAITAGVDVLPICLRYTSINGGPVTRENRDSVYYHGGTTFFSHIPRLLALRSIDVDILPLKIIRIHKNSGRKELAEASHAVIQEAYRG